MRKRGLVILDIDNTLIDTKIILKEQKDKYPKPSVVLSKKETNMLLDAPLAEKYVILIYKRPYLAAFLKFIFAHFHVAIWTAALENWMNVIINRFFKPYKNKILFRWHREHSNTTNIIQPTKPLFNVFNEFKKYKFNTYNTLFIDDNVNTTEYKLSHLQISKYIIENNKNDDSLKIITNLLRKQVKKNIFNPLQIIENYKGES